MPRLFVALDLPPATRADLVRIMPAACTGMRVTPPDQMHLTLHFFGESDRASVVAALRTVSAPAFSLTLAGVGQFGSLPRGVILWAGFRESRELQALHAAIAQKLLPTGYQPERRPYCPHLTLARCKPRMPQSAVDDFLKSNAMFTTRPFSVAEFSLYSSVLTPNGAEYRREESFPLLQESPSGGRQPPGLT